MKIPSTRFLRLQGILGGNVIPSKRVAYHCIHVDQLAIVFSESEGTEKVMLPTDVALEWISAFEFGLINIQMKARKMREVVTPYSKWAPYQHGFETHLCAIVNAWANQ